MGEQKNNKKNVIIAFVGAVIAIAVVVVAIIVLINRNKNATLGDDFFKSDDTKIVYTTSTRNVDSSYGAKKTHQVYTVDGSDVTGYTLYYEFGDEESAEDAYEEISQDVETDYTALEAKLDGKFVSIKYDEETYSGAKASEVRSWVKSLEEYDRTQDQSLLETEGEEIENPEDSELEDFDFDSEE